MPIRTKRWNDAVSRDDGERLLICRYRPRGVRKEDEPWDGWVAALAPSRELHAAVYGKHGPAIDFEEYARRFRLEMEGREYWLHGLAERVRRGDVITLLCSSACTEESRCHRSIVKALIEDIAFPAQVRGVFKRSAGHSKPKEPR